MTTRGTADDAPALIGLDWGSSSLRAYLFGADGRVLQQRAEPWGVLQVPDRDFACALGHTIDDWQRRAAPLPVIASGMIGSREDAGSGARLSAGAMGILLAPSVQRGPREAGSAAVVEH